MAASTRSMGLIATSLMLLFATPALSGTPAVSGSSAIGRKLKTLLDPVYGVISLLHYSNDKCDVDYLNILELDVILDGGYILKFVDKKNNDPYTLLSIKSILSDLKDGDISLLSININAFKGALLTVDADLADLVIVKVEVLEVNGYTNYLYHCQSADGKYKQLVRAFVGCGRLHVIRGQGRADKWSVLLPLFRKSLLSYVLKAVLCLVKTVLGR